MKNCSRIPKTPSIIEETAGASGALIDNLYADCCRSLNLRTAPYREGIAKRSGLEVAQAVFLLLIRVILRDSSMAMFCRKSKRQFFQASTDPICDLFKSQLASVSPA